MKRFTRTQIALARILLLVLTITLGTASIICATGEIPYTFSPGETISSAQVNANFQTLLQQITALQAQLTPAPQASQASVVGIYDYFSFGVGMSFNTSKDANNRDYYTYSVSRNGYRGTLVFNSSTVTLNGTGEYVNMGMNPYPSGNPISTYTDPDTGTQPYTISGSTVSIANGMAIGTLSADGKILILSVKSSNQTGMMIGIKRPPTITSATSSTADGHYNAGAAINITLNFSEAVTSTGLTITLNNGATVTTGVISNATRWSGTYIVAAGQANSDLSISTITGTITRAITDPTGNSTSNPTIPAGQNIGDSKAIIIE